jgi:methyl-accepting chemotaxis protein
MFGKLKIKATILGCMAVLAVGYLLLLAMVHVSATATHSSMSQISASLFPAALKMQHAEASFERMKKHYGDAVVLQDAKSLDDAEKDAATTNGALAEVKTALASSSELAKQADEIIAQFAEIRAKDHDTYAAILAAKDGSSDDLMAQVGVLGKENKALADAMGGFDKTVLSSLQTQLTAVDSWSVRIRVTGVVMLGFVVIVCAGAWWVIQSKVVEPLQLLVLHMREIAGGDLTRRMKVKGRTEIDEVGIEFNVFIASIEGIVRTVAEHAGTLGQAASDLAAAAHETAEQAAQQQQQAERITTAMNEMSSAVQEISQTTQSAAVDARSAEESAKSGGHTVQATVQTIGGLLIANQETSSRIEQLGRSSDAIGRIVSVHGRGFAVVAGEVRRLAERTSSATKEIDVTVHAIQEGTKVAVDAMRSSMSHVQSGVDSARSAGEALTSIIRGSESVQKMVTQIAAAATEQSYSTQSVSENVNEIAAIIRQTAASSQHSVQACEQLSRLAGELSGLVGNFKVGRI